MFILLLLLATATGTYCAEISPSAPIKPARTIPPFRIEYEIIKEFFTIEERAECSKETIIKDDTTTTTYSVSIIKKAKTITKEASRTRTKDGQAVKPSEELFQELAALYVSAKTGASLTSLIAVD
jgi:hypothetical protein